MWAVIDIGSNTIRLVIYSKQGGQLHSVLNKKYSAGLAGYMDPENRLNPEGVQKLVGVLSEIRSILDHIHVERIFPFGTASLRNSANREEVLDLVREKCRLDVRILSGEEEATFDYYGAMHNGINSSGLVVDVGGGSTELTFFHEKQIVTATSMPIGSLNLYKRFVEGLLPTEKEIRKIRKEVRSHLEVVQLPLPREELVTQPIYSIGGTARASLLLMRERFGIPEKSREYTRKQLSEFLEITDENIKGLQDSILRAAPERIHTIIPGLLIFESVSRFYGSRSFVVCSYGVREGYLTYLLEEKGGAA